MACFHPLDAWQQEDGTIVFRETRHNLRPLTLPCGRCIGCRLVRVRSWSIRCMHESQMHDVSSFVTLTFDDKYYKPSLEYKDFQKFMYRLRERFGATRFFACGEYGEINLRPHYHCLLFGRSFSNPIKCGDELYRSADLEKLWPFGFSSFGGVSYASAAYVAGYACKKISGAMADRHYTRVDLRTGELVRVVPEFGRMSLKPGIGAKWFEKYWREVYIPRDGVVQPGGKCVPPPRYYDKLLEKMQLSVAAEKEVERILNSLKFRADSTEERLAVRERCAIAKRNFTKRSVL